MTQEIKKPTLLEQALQDIATEATRSDVLKVAAKLDIVPPTVYDYLKGKVAKESRGKAILTELRKQVIKRTAIRA